MSCSTTANPPLSRRAGVGRSWLEFWGDGGGLTRSGIRRGVELSQVNDVGLVALPGDGIGELRGCWTASDTHLPTSILQYSVGGSGADLSEIRSQSDSDHHLVRDKGGDQIPDPGAVGKFLPCPAFPNSRPGFGIP